MWSVEVGGDGVLQLEHSPHARGVGGALWSCSWVRGGICPALSGMSFLSGVLRLAKWFLVDQGDAMVFGEHSEWSVTRVARLCALCVPPPGVLYVLWCFRCGLLFRVLPGFPLTNRAVWVS
jgi:hypothetical protein